MRASAAAAASADDAAAAAAAAEADAAAAVAAAAARLRLCNEWLENAQSSDEILLEASVARSRKAILLGEDNNCAMFVHDDAVILVHFAGPLTSKLEGRKVRLERGRLVHSVPMNVPKVAYNTCELLHPNCGVRMYKGQRGAQDLLRPALPSGMLRLKFIHQRLLDGDRCCPVGMCHVCTLPTLDKDICIGCALCGLSWHITCCSQLFDWAFPSEGSPAFAPVFADKAWNISAYPPQIRSEDAKSSELLCGFCKRVASA